MMLVKFTKRWLDIGADDIEHADYDSSATPDMIFDYFSKILSISNHPEKHIAHFHSIRGWGMANVLAALQAGIINFEATMGGTVGQVANFFEGVPIMGTGKYYNKDKNLTGLISTEDLALMLYAMGVETNLNIDKVLEIGKMIEKIIGKRLRSESIISGKISK